MSTYLDNDHKFIVVLNKKIELPRLLNALGHMSAGITSLLQERSKEIFFSYVDGSDTIHPAISKFPFIILMADNNKQIRTLRNVIISLRIPYNDFTDTMIGSSHEEQLAQTKKKDEQLLEYYGIIIFDKAEKLKPMTKKFSLFRI
ncbi:MAG: DUF2000 domain-containing protein [Chitinophagaceae bacterium]|nr:DUF2000 domain-containing protein [Chitinophagaceae bacterium]